MTADITSVRRALISVSDKTGLVDFARVLADAGIEIVSTGGTASTLAKAGIAVVDVATVTGFPEIMDGRVKTLHPAVHGGLLARRDHPGDQAAMTEHGIEPIDLLVVNLYPFEQTVAAGAEVATAIETIDIGGVALIRAAAKNHDYVAVIVEPDQYGEVADQIAGNGGTSHRLRQRLAAQAFARTAAYDAAIAQWCAELADDPAPARLAISGRLVKTLRYGENPHQTAAYYATGTDQPGLATAHQLQGKELSYNNLNDADAALELIADLDAEHPAIAIIKHANPCGVAIADTLSEAHARALVCDPDSAFGGIVAANRPLDRAAAQAITGLFTEVVIAPGADQAALEIFKAKPNLRLLVLDHLPNPDRPGRVFRSIAGGFLAQNRDTGRIGPGDLKIVTRVKPSPDELADLILAFRIAKHVKSNAIVYVKDGATVGIGAGQMSRVDSSRIAASKAASASAKASLAAPLTAGSVVASDAFFPFADGLEAAISAGATAVIQPGGSMRDQEVIEAADRAGVAMVFTGMRHFRH